jgi:hypothetical protein
MRIAPALVTLALLAVFASACGRQPADQVARPERFTYYIQGTSRASAAVAAFPNDAVARSTRPRFTLYGPGGTTPLWHADADSATILTGDAGLALAAWTPRTDDTGFWGNTSLASIADDGRAAVLGQWPRSSVRPLFVGTGRAVYAVADHRSTRICVRIGDRTSTLRLSLQGPIFSCSASADGARLALVLSGMQESNYTVVWATVSADGHARLVGSPAMVVNSSVALSDDGSRAVLGGRDPVLVPFGHETGRRLPVRYASQAWVGNDRVFIMRFWTVNGSARERAVLLDKDGRALWRLRLSGPASAIYADPSVRFAAYRRGSSGAWRLVDLRSGREETLGSTYTDVVPLRTGGFLGVDHSGRVTTGDSPFGRSQ